MFGHGHRAELALPHVLEFTEHEEDLGFVFVGQMVQQDVLGR